MATTYAIPVDGNAAHTLHGHGHVRSHQRKGAPERIPLRPTSMNGGFQLQPASPRKESPNGRLHTHAQSLPQNSWDNTVRANNQNFRANAQLPAIEVTLESPITTDSERMDQSVRRMTPRLHSQQDGYNYPSVTVHRRRSVGQADKDLESRWLTKAETIASILIPLPYVLASMVFTQVLSAGPPESLTIAKTAESILEKTTKTEPAVSVLHGNLLACALTSTTLILVGLLGKLRGGPTSLDRRKTTLGHASSMEKTQTSLSMLATARRVLGRILGVGLPFYAASKLGGAEVGVIMLTVMAGDLSKTDGKGMNITSIEGWKRLLVHRRWTIAATLLQIAAHIVGFGDNPGILTTIAGYLALGSSIFLVPFPYITSKPKASIITSPNPNSAEKTSAVAMSHWEMTPPAAETQDTTAGQSPLIYTPTDVNLTVVSGFVLGIFTYTTLLISTRDPRLFSLVETGWILVASGAAAISLTVPEPTKTRSVRKFGLALGLSSTVILSEMLLRQTWTSFVYQCVTIGCFWAATHLDAQLQSAISVHSNHHHHEKPHPLQHGNHSRFTGLLLRAFQSRPLLYSILVERDSRRIFYFMCLNFAFMLVQTFYALVTGSLGLLSDSIHMLFDCLALVVGLCASVMSKWPPSTRFPYGYGKMDTLAGFANGVFLMLISVEIVYEAIERLAEGSQMQRIGELLTVSSLGLVVNLVGMFAFGHAHHGHGHSHGGHGHDHSQGGHDHSHSDHDHSHSNHDHSRGDHCQSHTPHSHEAHHHNHSHHDHTPTESKTLNDSLSPLPFSVPATPSKPHPSHGKSHGGHSHHHHGNENMHGIFLHILADTLGSVAVVISTILIHYTGWAGFDPLASCLIAILIFASAVPLVTSSAKTLLLTVPEDTEFDLREALAGVSSLKGVVGVTAPRFWMGEGVGGKVGGVMHVMIAKGFEMEEVRERAVGDLAGRGMDVLVQVEKEGEGRCWCGGKGG